jgi:hypothetical protein
MVPLVSWIKGASPSGRQRAMKTQVKKLRKVTMPEGVITTIEAARILRVTPKAIRSAIDRGSIRAVILDGRNRKGRLGIPLTELERYRKATRPAIPAGWLTTAQAAEELADCGVTLWSLRSAISRGEVLTRDVPFRSGRIRKILSRREVARIREAHESDGPKWQLFG